jgi:hypothetical protein
MSDIARLYLPWQRKIGHLFSRPKRLLEPGWRRPMTHSRQSYADRYETLSPAFRPSRRATGLVAGAVRTLNLTVADALYAYAVTGSAFATLLVLAAPHLEVFVRCIFHVKG